MIFSNFKALKIAFNHALPHYKKDVHQCNQFPYITLNYSDAFPAELIKHFILLISSNFIKKNILLSKQWKNSPMSNFIA